MKVSFLFKFLAMGLVLTACEKKESNEKVAKIVQLDVVTNADSQNSMQYPGKVKASEEINLSFKVAGNILKNYVTEGQQVRQGQLIARIDPTDYQIQLDATEAEYSQVKAECERVMELYKENGTTANNNDKAVYGLKQITAKYKHHKDQLGYTYLYAPFSGSIQKVYFDSHEIVAAGMPVVTMMSNGVPEVEINIPARAYTKRNTFSGYQCTFDSYPGVVYHLKLINISQKANTNQLYTMRLQIVGNGNPMPSPGMDTTVSIFSSENGATKLTVPNSALKEENGKSYVFAFNNDTKKVEQKEVEIKQLLSNGKCIVTSNALQLGEQIVKFGVHHISNGETVEPVKANSQTNVGGLL